MYRRVHSVRRALTEMIERKAYFIASALVAVLACSLFAAPARGAEASEVEVLIRQGVELRHVGKDVQAVPVFARAYELERTPRTAGQLGLCELALGYWVDAEAHLGEALASEGHPWVRRNLQSLRSSLEEARRNVGEVEISAAPPTGDVLVDRHEVGPLPLARAVRLAKGPHDIEIRSPGHTAPKKAVLIVGGDKQSVTFELQEIVVAPPPVVAATPAPSASDKQPLANETVLTQAPTDPADAPPSSSDHLRTAAWVSTGLAVAALGVAVFETVRWSDKRQEFDAHTGPLMSAPGDTGPNCGLSEPNFGGSGCSAINDALSQARLVSLVGYGVAAAAGIGATIMFATSGSSSSSSRSSQPPPATQPALACAPTINVGAYAPTLGVSGVACRLTF
jgi:hypothetical protein